MPFNSENLYYKSKLYVEKEAFELEKGCFLWALDSNVVRAISSCSYFKYQSNPTP